MLTEYSTVQPFQSTYIQFMITDHGSRWLASKSSFLTFRYLETKPVGYESLKILAVNGISPYA